VTRSFISSCSSANVHSLSCGPRIAEEKESDYPAPSRFKSAKAGEYRGGGGGGRSGREEKLQARAAVALWYMRRYWGGVQGGGGNTCGGEERSGGARVWIHSTTSVTEEVCVAPLSDVYRKVGTQSAWSWGPVGSKLPLPGAKRWEASPRQHGVDRDRGC
jgi:hypothetical protein